MSEISNRFISIFHSMAVNRFRAFFLSVWVHFKLFQSRFTSGGLKCGDIAFLLHMYGV